MMAFWAQVMTVRGDMTVEMSPFMKALRVMSATRTMAAMRRLPSASFHSGILAATISASTSWSR
ncbi:hypothetical protein D3C80_1781560 [compost metagenome]